jgi:ergothioneine biosynthesis protein EgtB
MNIQMLAPRAGSRGCATLAATHHASTNRGEPRLSDFDARAADDPARIRRAVKELLSLALIDARNHTLRWIAAFEAAQDAAALARPADAALDAPLWLLGRIGWYAEHWTARHLQRARGERAAAGAARLASLLPEADRCFGPGSNDALRRGEVALPSAQALRQYLVDALESTLELLHGAAEDDDGLFVYRLALQHEDARREDFAVLAQALGVAPPQGEPVAPEAAARRDALFFPATRWRLGSERGAGFVPADEKWAHEVALPEFEIDAQPVSWAQFAEFVEDGGYDEPAHWSEAGRAWLAREARRTPRYVDRMRQGVLQRRFGRLVHAPLAQPALHLSWYEADAWCRWAGRRLPAEVEWEAAASLGASRGLRWGDVAEWTATTYRPYPGFEAGPDESAGAGFGAHKVLRGASFATAPRLRHPKRRRGAPPEADADFAGFRSCAPL